MTKPEELKCCICNGPVEPWYQGSKGYGHSPYPLKSKGRCCNTCNDTRVVPTRIALTFSRQRNREHKNG